MLIQIILTVFRAWFQHVNSWVCLNFRAGKNSSSLHVIYVYRNDHKKDRNRHTVYTLRIFKHTLYTHRLYLIYIYMVGGLNPSEKYEFVIGMMTFPIYGKMGK